MDDPGVGEEPVEQWDMRNVLRGLVSPPRLPVAAREIAEEEIEHFPEASTVGEVRRLQVQLPFPNVAEREDAARERTRLAIGVGIAPGRVEAGDEVRLGRDRDSRMRAQQVAEKRCPAS